MGLNRNVAGDETMDADYASQDCYAKQDPLRGAEELFAQFPPGDVVEDCPRRVDDESEQQELGSTSKQQEDRVERRQHRDHRVLAEFAGILLVSLFPKDEHESERRREEVRNERQVAAQRQSESEGIIGE